MYIDIVFYVNTYTLAAIDFVLYKYYIYIKPYIYIYANMKKFYVCVFTYTKKCV